MRGYGVLSGFDPAPFETMRPGEWSAQGVDPSATVESGALWNPTFSADPAIVAQVNQMLANGINPVTGRPTALNQAVLTKGYRWEGSGNIVDPNTQQLMGNAFDLGLGGVQALPDAQRGAIAVSPEAVEFQDFAPYTPATPSGWHAGELNGRAGYWGPDGLFYAGEAPWLAFAPGTGEHITPPFQSAPSPSPATSTGSASGATTGGVPDDSGLPLLPGSGWTAFVPPSGGGGNLAPPPTGAPVSPKQPVLRADADAAGFGSMGLLLGIGLIGAVIASRRGTRLARSRR